jgi:[acyl-carrier-protein] S-malonyltransferase
LSPNGIVFLFPAFASDYRENDSFAIPGYQPLFSSLLAKASERVDRELMTFHPVSNNFLDQNLWNQCISYIQSCTCSGLLRKKGIKPDLLAGYSMGIYAALADSGSISFESGIDLIRAAHEEIARLITGKEFAVCAVIGLDENDIRTLMARTDPEIVISNRNGEFSFVLTGPKKAIISLLLSAREEGAIHTQRFNFGEPYHSSFLAETAKGFKESVNTIPFRIPVVPVISSIDQCILTTAEELKAEVVRNLYQPFNWYVTNLRLKELGYGKFIECSPLHSLVKIAKFLPGSFSYFPASSLLSSPFPAEP